MLVTLIINIFKCGYKNSITIVVVTFTILNSSIVLFSYLKTLAID